MGDFVINGVNLEKYTGNGGDVVIPDGVLEISYEAFGELYQECRNVTSIILPASVERIDSLAICNCPDLKAIHVELKNDSFCEVDGILYSKDKKTLVRCPEAITGEVEIPVGVKLISYGAFYGCKQITSVKFSNTVQEIEGSAFYGCSSIIDFILPDSIEVIGYNAFSNMDSLTTLVIPKKVSDFGQIDNKILESVEVDAENVTYSSIDGILFSKAGRNVQFCPCGKKGAVVLSENVRGINSMAFSGCEGITEVNIPSKVTKIGRYAFSCCKKIRTISIPAGVKSIKAGTFSDCSSLESVQLNEGLVQIDAAAFKHCEALKRIELPKTITKVAKTSFTDGLVIVCYPEIFKKLNVENKIKTAIEYLKSNEEFNEEQSSGVIAFIASSKGKVLNAVVEIDCVEALIGYNTLQPLTKKEITTSLKTATDKGFVQITAALLEIQNGGGKAPEKEKVKITKKEKKAGRTVEKVNKADWKKPKAGTALIGRYIGNSTSITYPLEYDGIDITGTADVAGAIPDNYKNIESVAIPEGYTVIGKNTFSGCEKLISVTLPSTLRSIGTGAFKGCKSLKTLVFPEGVSIFGNGMFDECNFETVELPSGLEFLPKHCFDGALVETIIFRGSTLTSDGRVFDWGNEPKTIYTDGKIKIYNITKRVIKSLKALESRGIVKEKTEADVKKEWKFTELKDGTLRIDDYKGIDSDVVIPSEIDGKSVTVIGEGVFKGDSLSGDDKIKKTKLQKDVIKHIKSITLPETIIRIEKEAFCWCPMNKIIMSDNIEYIGDNAFNCCKNLKIMNWPKNLKAIGKVAFAGIHSISNWILPENLELIEEGAFAYNEMESIYIPESVKAIGDHAITDVWGEGLTILGKEGSAAEEYAKKEGLTFEVKKF